MKSFLWSTRAAELLRLVRTADASESVLTADWHDKAQYLLDNLPEASPLTDDSDSEFTS